MMMFYYSAQIHLRKVLNRVHTDLYKAESKHPSPAFRMQSLTPVCREGANQVVVFRAGSPQHEPRIVEKQPP